MAQLTAQLAQAARLGYGWAMVRITTTIPTAFAPSPSRFAGQRAAVIQTLLRLKVEFAPVLAR